MQISDACHGSCHDDCPEVVMEYESVGVVKQTPCICGCHGTETVKFSGHCPCCGQLPENSLRLASADNFNKKWIGD